MLILTVRGSARYWRVDVSIGFTVPFAVSTGSVGYFETTQTEIDAVAQDLRSLLLTNQGERLGHYNFGCNIRKYIFEPRTEELRETIADRVQGQVSLWMPFVTLDQLNVIFSEDDSDVPESGVRVFMRYRISNKPELFRTLDVSVTP